MITRTTTVGILKNYRYDLNRSNNTMAKSMNTVITRRQFNSYAEDPSRATRCFQLRRAFQRANSQYTINESTVHKYNVAWKSLDSVTTNLYDITEDRSDSSLYAIVRGLNGADASARNALGQALAARAKGMVQTMNDRYGENYVFAGADHLNVPFTWDGVRTNPNYIDNIDPTKEECAPAYRYLADPDKVGPDIKYTNDPDEALLEPVPNKDYDPDDPSKGGKYMAEVVADPHNPTTNDLDKAAKLPVENPSYRENWNFKYLKEDGTGTNDYKEAGKGGLCYRGVPVDSMSAEDREKMDYFLKDETRNLDVGLGFKEKDGEAISSSVFDSGLQGVYYLGGYGTEVRTETIGEGDDAREVTAIVPNNVISIVNRMGEILMNCNSDDGSWASAEERDEFQVLARKFEDTVSLVGQRYAEMDTESGFLRDNSELLKGTTDTLNEQITALEDVDPAAAISDYMFARYCYDAALKVGNSVLSQSLMDYMSF